MMLLLEDVKPAELMHYPRQEQGNYRPLVGSPSSRNESFARDFPQLASPRNIDESSLMSTLSRQQLFNQRNQGERKERLYASQPFRKDGGIISGDTSHIEILLAAARKRRHAQLGVNPEQSFEQLDPYSPVSEKSPSHQLVPKMLEPIHNY